MFCINPNCSHPKNSDKHLFCITCGSELLLNGRYRVIRLLSDKGGFAVTYEVTHNDVHKVLKVLNNDHPDAVRLFEQEANILTQLNHPGIPKGEGEFIYFPRDSQTPIHCFVMEKIEGMDLEEYQRNRQFRPIDEKLALEWLKQLVEILDVVHSNNFFHLDIKPSNIIFQPNGQLSLIDFGVVRQVTATIMSNNKNTGIYTPGYAPPEQEKGFAVPQSDFYALGRIFVYLLTGKEPTDADIYDPHNDELNWRKFAGDISEELADFLDILMARKATQRPANTQVILQTLSSYLGEKILIVCQTGIGKYHYKSISEAIKNAKPGTKIMVRPGTYKEGLVINKEVEIIGDGLRENIIIESTESDCILMETDKALVKGLTLRGKAGTNNNKYSTVDIPQGKLILDDCDITSDSLSCIAIHGVAANPTIRNCQIHDGKESGVYVYNKGQATVDNCDIFSNTLSGIEIKEEGNVLIRNCQIHDTKQAGVNVYNKGQGTVDDCDIFSNFNSGIAIREEGNPTIRDCQIHDNKKAGVFVHNKGQRTVKNCDIFSNTLSGIAIREEGNPTIRNCQIHDTKKRGVYVYNKGQGTVENCEIFANTYSQIDIKKYCKIQVIQSKVNGKIVNKSSSRKNIIFVGIISIILILILLTLL